MSMLQTARQIWRDFITDGIPSSGNWRPKKSDIRAWGAWLESFLAAIGANSGSVFQTRAALFADLAHVANSMAWVLDDATTAYNGIYQKIGSSGAGSWVRVGDLPYSFIVASDIGAGTANAIQATTEIPVTASALIWLAVNKTNTSSPVTISFNGDTSLTIKTNSGSNPLPGGLVANSVVLGIVSGGTFRLLSDQASAAIQAAAEAAAADAANYAALARNDVVINAFTGDGATTDFTLTVDPGSANNVRVNMNGSTQLHSSYSLVYVSSVPKLRFTEAPPDGASFEAELGSRIAVGTPADGSITTPKLASAGLRSISALTSAAGKMLYTTATDIWALADITSFGRSIMAAADALAARTALGLDWEFIEQRTFSAQAQVDFVNLGSYRRIKVEGFVNVASAAKIFWQSSTNNGTSFSSGASDYVNVNTKHIGAVSPATVKTTISAAEISDTPQSGTNQMIRLEIEMWNVSGTCRSQARVSGINSTPDYYIYDSATVMAVATARNALRILAAGNAAISGELVIRGSRK